MAYKRPRAAFEADQQGNHSSNVFYGTPLPPLDKQTRDDGSYVPVWKQEVTDERGRKRLHGAFTGGFSAGYFNTVGSKDGWTPSTFVSSRAEKRAAKEKQSNGPDGHLAEKKQQRPEDFMDEEDLADAEESKKLATTDGFAGLGSTEDELAHRRGDNIMDLFRAQGETKGVKLLRRMGWRDGQGVGPKVRRKALLGDGEDGAEGETHLFAPENTHLISFVRKNDHKGLGFRGEGRLADGTKTADSDNDDEAAFLSRPSKTTKKLPASRGGFGVGILNDNGSDDEDPYHIGPQISYNKVIGADKKKTKKLESRRLIAGNANPLLRSKPVFISKKGIGKAGNGFRKCHDGRLPMDGFVLSSTSSSLSREKKYPSPVIPPDWKSTRTPTSSATTEAAAYQSSADLARASTLNPNSRATLLGETLLPGKSVFDFLTPAARSRIANITNNDSLPPALSEAPSKPPGTSEPLDPASMIPPLDPQVAATALGRGVSGFIPYTENPAKLARYRAFLSFRANLTVKPPEHDPSLGIGDWLKELHEFAHAAVVFKPMTGLMASRFTSSSSTTNTQSQSASSSAVNLDASGVEQESILSHPIPKPQDPAEEAARVGMFGPLTRSSVHFYPNRLLCKRFNVKPPDHVAPDATNPSGTDSTASPSAAAASASAATIDTTGRFHSSGFQTSSGAKNLELIGKKEMEELRRESARMGIGNGLSDTGEAEAAQQRPVAVVVDPERNEALEAERPGEAVFRAIFGSDSEDD